jgi:signal transduction histidine kinase
MNSATLERFGDKVAQIVRASGIGIFSLSPADNRLYPQTVKNGSAAIDLEDVQPVDVEDQSRFSASVWRALNEEEHEVIHQTVQLDFVQMNPPIMVVPIIWSREPIEEGEDTVKRPVGVMILWDKRGAEDFDADDHSLADSLGAQAASLLVEEQLAEFEDIQAAFTTVPVGLMLIGQDDHIVVANQAARRVLGQTNLTGMPVEDIDYQNQLLPLIKDARNGKAVQSAFVAPEGGSFISSAQATAEKQIILAFSHSPIDQDAEELVGQVAHELRTPLTVIQGNLQTVDALFEGGELTDEDVEIVNEFIGTSLIQASRMYRMIDETLNLSRIHVGKELELDIHEFDLIEAIEQIFLELEDRLIRFEIDPNMPDELMMDGDRAKIISILDNFLKNASKYADPGTTITLDVSVIDDNTVEIAVTDQGVGIPEDAIDRIGREAGFRTEVSRDKAGGIGLGMVYTRRVIEGHGGKMEIESELGEGSTFRAILPIRQNG